MSKSLLCLLKRQLALSYCYYEQSVHCQFKKIEFVMNNEHEHTVHRPKF